MEREFDLTSTKITMTLQEIVKEILQPDSSITGEQIVNMTTGALTGVLAMYTFFFRNETLELRYQSLQAMVDIMETVAKHAGEQLLTHDQSKSEQSDVANSERKTD